MTASYPNGTVAVPDYTPGQTLGSGGTDHGTMHTKISEEVNALGLFAAKATRGGEELIYTPATQTTAYTVDLTLGNIHRVTMGGNVSFTLPAGAAIPNGRAVSFLLELIQDATGARVPAWNATIVKWLAGSAPTLAGAAAKRNFISFMSTDDGATWIGSYLGSV